MARMNVPEADEGALERRTELALTLALSRERERGYGGAGEGNGSRQTAAANASRVRFSGAAAVQTTSSSMRMPPYLRNASTLSQFTSLATGFFLSSASSMSMK